MAGSRHLSKYDKEFLLNLYRKNVKCIAYGNIDNERVNYYYGEE